MEKIYNVGLDLYKPEVVRADLSGRAVQFAARDENVYSIFLSLTIQGEVRGSQEPYTIEAGTDVIINIKPANAIFAEEVAGTIVDAQAGLVKVSFATGFEVLGEYTATVYLKKGSNSLTWGQRFVFNVAAGVAATV